MRPPNDSHRDGMTATVIGGTSSVDAKLDDLRATSAVLRTTGTMMNTVAASVANVHLVLQSGGDAESPTSSRACVSAAATLHGQLLNAGAQADGLACAMDLTAATYELAEKTSAALFNPTSGPGIGATGTSLWGIVVGLTDTNTKSISAAEAITRLDAVLPGSYEDAIATMNTVLRKVYDPDAAASTRLVTGPGQTGAPAAARSVGTSMKQVEAMYGDNRETSHIQVQRVVDPTTGRGHWVAMLPGTSEWSPNHRAVLNGADNLPALAGGLGEAEKAVTFALEDAMRREGVLDKHEPVMLVGHSQGGIVMTNLARNAARSKLNVTRVVTYGSPVGRMKVPPGVRTLNIENSRDIVPKADGWATGDGDPRRTRVLIDDPSSIYTADGKKSVIAAHDPATYRQDYETTVERESKNAASGVTRFEKDSKVFFDGKARTYQYDAQRPSREGAMPAAGSTEDKPGVRPPALVNPSTGTYVVTGP